MHRRLNASKALAEDTRMLDREQIVTCTTCGVDFRPGIQPGQRSRIMRLPSCSVRSRIPNRVCISSSPR